MKFERLKNVKEVEFPNDTLDANQKAADPFFTRRQHQYFDVFFPSHSISDLPKRTIRKNTNITTSNKH